MKPRRATTIKGAGRFKLYGFSGCYRVKDDTDQTFCGQIYYGESAKGAALVFAKKMHRLQKQIDKDRGGSS